MYYNETSSTFWNKLTGGRSAGEIIRGAVGGALGTSSQYGTYQGYRRGSIAEDLGLEVPVSHKFDMKQIILLIGIIYVGSKLFKSGITGRKFRF
jgi:hypothetical protein